MKSNQDIQGESKSLSNKTSSSTDFFQPDYTEEFLLHVARGKQDEAEGILKKFPKTILNKGKCKDYSDRTFKGITALQYAIWAKDIKMLNMLLKYLDKKDVIAQWSEMETKKFISQHGAYYDFAPLINTVKELATKHTSIGISSEKDDCLTRIGMLQRLVPVHVANEYCQGNGAFDPDCSKEKLERTLKVEYPDPIEWYPLVANKGLGFDFAIFRVSCNTVAWTQTKNCSAWKSYDAEKNAIALENLDATRTKELQAIKQEFFPSLFSSCSVM